jgi:hypothetical protein
MAEFQAAHSPMGVLDLNLNFLFLQWILLLVTPHLTINGYPQRRKWGRHFIELPPGTHHVRVSFPYLFTDHCGPADAMVPIYPGMATRLDYEAPLIVFMGGTLRMYGPFQLNPPMLGGGSY